MPKTLFFSLLAFAILFSAGCSSEPAETITLKIDGLGELTGAIETADHPFVIQMDDKSLLCTHSGDDTYRFYELVEGKLKIIEIVGPPSSIQ